MKASKVNHTKAAVGVRKNDKETKGFIYDNPYVCKNEHLTLENRIKDLNQNAKNLYNILNQNNSFTEDEDILKICKKINGSIGIMIKFLMNVQFSKPELRVENQICELKKLSADSVIDKNKKGNIIFDKLYVPFKNNNSPEKESVINDLTEHSLRKTLRKQVKINAGTETLEIKKIAAKFIYAVITPRNFQNLYNKISDKEIRIFLDAVNEDYEKKNRIHNIAVSIERQNVKVQTVSVDGSVVLHLSSAHHDESKKENLKKYIFKFITDYTKKSMDEQKKMIIHIRQLILLYYSVFRIEDRKPDVEKNKELLEFVISEERFEKLPEDYPKYFCPKAQDLYVRKQKIMNSEEKKGLSNDILQELSQQIIVNYTACRTLMNIPEFFAGISDENICWLNYISSVAEKILIKKKKWKYMNIHTLCRLTFEEWKSFIAKKYIDMGKAVYHFALPDLLSLKNQKEAVIGKVNEPYTEGLTSFDYERIKAEENIDRDMSVYITFAAQNFFRCVCDNEQREKEDWEDVLQYKEKHFSELLGIKDKEKNDHKNNEENIQIKEVKRKLMQFWGGMSKWKDQIDDIAADEKMLNFVLSLKNEIALLRNSCYHYTAFISKDAVTDPVINKLFDIEYSRIGQIIFDKYYSNNVFAFYKIENIKNLASHLYAGQESRPAQIPAFKRIVNKNNLDEFMMQCIGYDVNKKIKDIDAKKNFRSAFFFLLKEIYYHSFLLQNDIKEKFISEIKRRKRSSDFKEKRAAENLSNRLDTMDEEISFGELCQTIMTDFNMQNQGNMKVKIKTDSKQPDSFDEEIYQHFKMLLYDGIKKIFADYIINEKHQSLFAFLKNPSAGENKNKEEVFELFNADKNGTWKPKLFQDVYNAVHPENSEDSENSENPAVLAWYTTAHFMNPKHLNLLIGSIKNYIQFIHDIDKRIHAAKITNRTAYGKQKTEKYISIVRILEFTQLFCGQTTNCLKDYFIDKDDYAAHAANYVNLDSPTAAALQAFCEQNAHTKNPNDRLGVYYDAVNPIVNRNIVFASMYGMDSILKECVQLIEESEIQNLYEQRDSLKEVFNRGHCETIEEQRRLRNFENKKNRIELVNIMIYSEIINDLMAQLVSWAYLRERDLMYFQLGYYYVKLFCGEKMEQDDWMRRLIGNEINICDGAVLYQIAAMYTYMLPVYGFKKGNVITASKYGSTGESVNAFYKKYCNSDASIYDAGLSLFEILNEHDFIVSFRNDIDHFKYFARTEKSILDYYSEIFDRFFDYDIKLKKSMSYIFKNILARYFVAADTAMQGTCLLPYKNIKNIDTRENTKYAYRKDTGLQIKNNGLHSSMLTYKVKGKEVLVNARDEVFLKELQNILEYKKTKNNNPQD